MITLIFSLLFSIAPAVLVGKLGVGAGYIFLTYLCSVIFSFIGAKIGKIIRDFADPLFVSSNSIVGLAMEKFNALYGTQISFFILGLFLAVMLFSGKSGRISGEAAKAKNAITKKAVDIKNIEMIPIEGGAYNAWNYKYLQKKTDEDDVFVEIPDFAMSKRPVTRGLYQTLNGKQSDSLQKLNLSFVEAVIFCNDLSKKHKLNPCYSFKGKTETSEWLKNINTKMYGWEMELEDSVVCDFSANGYRLPTEVEWEYVYYDENYNPDKAEYTPSSNTTGVYFPERAESYLCWNWYTENKKYYEEDIYGPSVPDKYCHRVTRKLENLGRGETGRVKDQHYGLVFLCRTVSDSEWQSLKKKQEKEQERLRGMLPKMLLVKGGSFEKRDYQNHTSETIYVDDFYINTENVSDELIYEISYEYLNEFYFGHEDKYEKPKDPAKEHLAGNFCNRLSAALGFIPCLTTEEVSYSGATRITTLIIENPNADGFRKPSENEMEYFNSKYERDDSIKRIVKNGKF